MGAAEDQLLRLLLRHLHGAGVRDAVPAPGAPDGAGQHRGPAGRLVRRQHRPGLRVRGPDTGVLRLGRRRTTPSTTSVPPRPRSAGVVPGPGQAEGAPDRRPDRPDDRPRRVRRHLPGGRLQQQRTGRAWPSRWPPTCTPARPASWSARSRRWARRTRTSSPSTTRCECSDVNWPRNWAKWDADTRRVYRTAPFEAWDNAWFNAACAFWPVRGPAQPLQIRGRGAARHPDAPGHAGRGDPLRGRAGGPPAAAHAPGWWWCWAAATTASRWLSPPNTCVNGYLNRYLATGALPSRPGLVNAVCPATPPPAAA